MAKGRLGALTVGRHVFWSQLRAEPSVVATIFGAVFLTALFITAAPRLLERVSREDLVQTIDSAEPEQRNVRVEGGSRIGAGSGGDPFDLVRMEGETILRQEFPQSVRSLITDQGFVVDSPRFVSSSFPNGDPGPFDIYFQFRYQEGVPSKMTLIDGDLPRGADPIPMLDGTQCRGDPLAVEDFDESAEVDCSVMEVPVYETALSAETAEVMMVSVGDRLMLRADSSDVRWLGATTPQLSRPLVVSISGIIELADPDDEYWYGDGSMHQARIFENPDFRLIYAKGLLSPDLYGSILDDVAGRMGYSFRYYVDADLVGGSLEELSSDLTRISAPDRFQTTTQLHDLIGESLERRRLTVQVMSTAATGLVAAALALVLTLAALVASRQRASTVLLRNRGASRGQLALTRAYQGIVLTVPPTLLGLALAAYLIPDARWLTSSRAAAVLAAMATIAVVAAGAPLAHRRLGGLQRTADVGASGLRRRVWEGLTLAAAVGAVILLRRRGQIDLPRDTVPGFDPLLAIAPALIGVAAGLLTLRLYPPLMRFGAFVGARSGGLVPFVGFRRVSDQPASGRLPVVVSVVAIGVAIFSSVVQTSIDQGQAISAFRAVGADYRIDSQRPGIPLPEGLQGEALPGVDASASAAEFPATSVLGTSPAQRVDLIALDFEAYNRVTSTKPRGMELPESLRPSHEHGALPAVISTDLADGQTLEIGSQVGLDLGSVDPVVDVQHVLDRLPGIETERPFVVVDLPSLRALFAPRPLPPSLLFLSADQDFGDEIASSVARLAPRAEVHSSFDVQRTLIDTPLTLWISRGLAFVFYAATLFACVAVVSSIALATVRRRRDFGYLRTMGVLGRQTTWLGLIEQIPIVLISTSIGALLGVGTARLLWPALDLEAFTGQAIGTSVAFSPRAVASAAFALLAAMWTAVVIFVRINREQEASVLIAGED